MSSRRPQLSLYELIDIGLAAVQISKQTCSTTSRDLLIHDLSPNSDQSFAHRSVPRQLEQ